MTRFYPVYFLLTVLFFISISGSAQSVVADSLKSKSADTEITDGLNLADPVERKAIRKLESELLGRIYISTIKPENMLAAYTVFINKVKEKSGNWTAADWNRADHIIRKMHFRRKELEQKITISDLMKIKALQIQYRTMETGQDAKNLFDNETNK